MFNVTPGGAPPSSTWNALDFVSMVSLTAMLAKLAGASNAQPLRLLAVLLSFDIGKRVKKFSSGLIDPLLTGTILSWMSLAVAAEAGWFELLGRFVTSRGSLGLWRSWGPGDFLLSCLGPSIVSLSLRVYANRKAVKENAPMVLVGSFWGAFFGLVSSAVIAGPLLKMPPSAALSLLPRSVTSALSALLAGMIGQGADTRLSVTFAVVTGLIGANFGGPLLAYTKKRFGVGGASRGLAQGAAGHGLGTAAIASSDPEALPFSAVAFALTAAASALLLTIAPFKDLLTALASSSVV
uniref:LrgB-like protein n=1 Tax=Chromera velia CCMP2878 TaxID=1169474 RepID=A0A0G4G1K8_9ALVE|eukprot:Cvel_19671.t1-p1 / transcript=Cvel_19671.t1 / gene=Cvel_19671 / organism=Chromera_velia_CCMP2878 / gene_product=Plastidal glycolate/glycerate translocator 1,, putative / transcript_product=Plastidal glycolate/glycerate translocator 1,, putative / location=Cvel_scaffold1714:39699-40580(-) / protein_length=294 / sequence_SO=supercontig / SO=protein_coding / is_pseudo=false